MCFVGLFLSGISVTFDYLSYSYIYKLIVSDNNRGFDLPAISFCTEKKVFFDKYKIIAKFNLNEKHEEYKRSNEEIYGLKHKNCIKDIKRKIEQEEKEGKEYEYGELGPVVCNYIKIRFSFMVFFSNLKLISFS